MTMTGVLSVSAAAATPWTPGEGDTTWSRANSGDPGNSKRRSALSSAGAKGRGRDTTPSERCRWGSKSKNKHRMHGLPKSRSNARLSPVGRCYTKILRTVSQMLHIPLSKLVRVKFSTPYYVHRVRRHMFSSFVLFGKKSSNSPFPLQPQSSTSLQGCIFSFARFIIYLPVRTYTRVCVSTCCMHVCI